MAGAGALCPPLPIWRSVVVVVSLGVDGVGGVVRVVGCWLDRTHAERLLFDGLRVVAADRVVAARVTTN